MIDLPTSFSEKMRLLLPDSFDDLAKSLDAPAPVSIRINPLKRAMPMGAATVSWCDTGCYLPHRPSFTFDPLFHAGCYYVQEAASMFLEQVIRAKIDRPITCLDLCAAPGGKSTHLLSLLPEGSLLVSNEVIKSRNAILVENLMKWGDPNLLVTQDDPRVLGRCTHLFDLIVADLPCSGEGLFRKEPESRKGWSSANVQHCALRQRRIIHDVWEALKPGGLLIYSTCTFNTEENEENILSLATSLEAVVEPLTIPAAWLISGALRHDNPVYRFFPHRTRGEGFFMALLRKPEGKQAARKSKRAAHLPGIHHPEAAEWLHHADSYLLEEREKGIHAIPRIHLEHYRQLSEHITPLITGVPIGETKGKALFPSTALALSSACRREAFPTIDLTRQEAIRYLQKEALTLPEGYARGAVMVTYRDQPLGFVKNIGGRANNLYPTEWRIRSRHLPDLHEPF